MKNIIRTGIIAVSFAILVIGYYTYLTRMNSGSSTEVKVEKQSEKELVLNADFAKNYPQTPREVVKWYNRILALYYSENMTEEEIERLCDKTRILMDDELAAQNPPEEYLNRTRAKIKEIQTRGQKLVTSEVADTKDIVKTKLNGDNMAYVLSYYCIKEGQDYQTTFQKYALRRDHRGKYKIVAFKQSDRNGS
ncbi:MAG: hypothetical protein K6F00_11390 [Lachnospiraceae bacterium]|nr:hypothetical protein [Lachnospiraceae bacterium]